MEKEGFNELTKVIEPIPGSRVDGQIIADVMNRMGYEQAEYHPAWVLDEIAKIVPFFAGVKWSELGDNGKQWPVDKAGNDSQIMHQKSFSRGLGKFEFHAFKESNEIIENGADFPYIGSLA